MTYNYKKKYLIDTSGIYLTHHYSLIPLLPAGVCGQRTSCHCTQSCSSWGSRAGGRHHCVWSSVWNYSTSGSHSKNRHTYPPVHQKMYRETEKDRKRHETYEQNNEQHYYVFIMCTLMLDILLPNYVIWILKSMAGRVNWLMFWWIVAIDFHSIFFHTMEVNGYQQLFGNQHSSKYLLCSTEERKSGFETTWGWVNDDRIKNFGWTIPLRGWWGNISENIEF